MGANTSSLKNRRKSCRKTSTQKESFEINDQESLRPSGYRLSKTIGKGGYAKVKKAYSIKHRRQVAIKIVDSLATKEDFRDRFLLREKQVSYVANHPNVVRCFEILECGPKVYMILEYIPNGDLCRYIRKKKFLDEEAARRMFQGIVSAVSYLHSRNVAHRDLKLENILLTNDLTPKLGDFGFAKKVRHANHRSVTFCGSKMYACFEILLGIPYNIFKADVWSLGVILFAMVTGHFPFSEEKQLHAMKKGVSFKGSAQEVSFDLTALIRKMLETNPNKRYSIQDVANHYWTRPYPEKHPAVEKMSAISQ